MRKLTFWVQDSDGKRFGPYADREEAEGDADRMDCIVVDVEIDDAVDSVGGEEEDVD